MKVAVVMGGPSAEREVSIESGTCVMRALATLGHDAKSLDFDERFIDAIREIAEGSRNHPFTRITPL